MNWDDLAVTIMFKICLLLVVTGVIASLYILGAIIQVIAYIF